MDIKRSIGSQIQKIRKAKGLSQEELSEKVGLSSKYISSIERGNENPTLDTFIKLSRALNVGIVELFNYSADTTQKDSKKFLIDLISKGSKDQLDMAAKLIRALYL